MTTTELTAKTSGGNRGRYATLEQPDGLLAHPRGLLSCLLREVERGDELSEAEAQRNIEVAVQVRDGGKSERDRLWAIRLLEAMRDRGYNIAMYLDKQERPPVAPPGVTVNLGVQFVIQRDDAQASSAQSSPAPA